MTTDGGNGATDSLEPGAWGADRGHVPTHWDFEADVVVVGAGATGLRMWTAIPSGRKSGGVRQQAFGV